MNMNRNEAKSFVMNQILDVITNAAAVGDSEIRIPFDNKGKQFQIKIAITAPTTMVPINTIPEEPVESKEVSTTELDTFNDETEIDLIERWCNNANI